MLQNDKSEVSGAKNSSANQFTQLDESDFTYLQEAFHVPEFSHKRIVEKVRKKLELENGNKSDTISISSISSSKSQESLFYRNLLADSVSIEYIKSHIVLLKTLVKHEISTSKPPSYQWMDDFNATATKILKCYATATNIEEPYISFAKWAAYAEIHQTHPINLKNFHKLLDNMTETLADRRSSPVHRRSSSMSTKFLKFLEGNKNEDVTKSDGDIQLKMMDEEVVKLFWNTTKVLQDSFLNFIKNLINNPTEDKAILVDSILINILENQKKIDKIHPQNNPNPRKFTEAVIDSLTDGTIEHLQKQMNQKIFKQAKHIEQKLNQLIKVLQFTQKHFRQLTQEFGQIFTS